MKQSEIDDIELKFDHLDLKDNVDLEKGDRKMTEDIDDELSVRNTPMAKNSSTKLPSRVSVTTATDHDIPSLPLVNSTSLKLPNRPGMQIALMLQT